MSQSKPTVALALAGGNALGAFNAGAYQALHERGYLPDLVSGASIGGVVGGLIAGNPPEQRLARLKEFWKQATVGSAVGPAPSTGRAREWYNSAHSLQSLLVGRAGFFFPRLPGMWSILPGMPPDVALLDNRPLAATLEKAIDFEYLNRAQVGLLLSAVDMESGERVTFDSRKQALGTDHFLATTAFVPAFPPVEIDGRCLADPGLIGNLPVDALLDPPQAPHLLCFAVDLFDSRGKRPVSLDTGAERAQDIVFGSQSLRAIEAHARESRLRSIIHELSALVPEEQRKARRAAELLAEGWNRNITVVLISYRARPHELATKTFEFSRASIEERWASGMDDMNAALDRLETGEPTTEGHGFRFYDARGEVR